MKESDIVKKMKGTFDNNFLGCNFVPTIAAVFDPRTNLEFMCYSSKYLYGDSIEKHTVIEDGLDYIFNANAKNLSSSGLSCSFINNYNGFFSCGDYPCSILDKWKKSQRGSRRVELNKYLRESLILSDGEFGIFGWWHSSEFHSY